MSECDPRALRAAFGRFITGVTVVTARAAGGVPVGFTANSFASVSLDPPLLLVCPARTLSSFDVFDTCAHFAVSILAEGQQQVSQVFASGAADRFAQVAWRADARGCPLIDDAAAHFSCAAWQRFEAGDHLILTGRVEAFHASRAPGLGYAAGEYFSAGAPRGEGIAHRPMAGPICGARPRPASHFAAPSRNGAARPRSGLAPARRASGFAEGSD